MHHQRKPFQDPTDIEGKFLQKSSYAQRRSLHAFSTLLYIYRPDRRSWFEARKWIEAEKINSQKDRSKFLIFKQKAYGHFKNRKRSEVGFDFLVAPLSQ